MHVDPLFLGVYSSVWKLTSIHTSMYVCMYVCVHVNVVGDLNALIAQASTVIQAASSSKDGKKTLASLLPSEKLDNSSDPT